MSQDEMQSLAAQIADTLGETEPGPCAQIAAIIEKCGMETARSLLEETQAIQAKGGMMLPNKSRMRTPGGVYFYLARKQLPRDVARTIFLPREGWQQKPKIPSDLPASQPSKPVFDWDDRLRIIEPLLAETGEIVELKVTITGRPGKIDDSHKDLIITTMSYTFRQPSFPKGVPQPPQTPVVYTIYISAKQWKKVEESLTNPDDFLIVEGSCAFDEQVGGMAVYALGVSTKHLDVKRRDAQKAAVDAEGDGGAKPRRENVPAARPSRPRREFDGSAAPSVTATATMPGVPTEVSQKLTELYASASLFRQKIAAIQSKPAGQQFGLEMTQKLLKNIEEEIAAIEKKYQ